ncbi:MAG: ribokinase [Ktedonobacteraceae bacterium]|nr:ribokinase [Ktedonobacteraceae bacterium]
MSVVVLGSINLDLIAQVAHRPRAGETLLADQFQTSPGGKGANQALAACRMGASVTMLGAVGADHFAEAALSLMQQEGVDLSRVKALECVPTGLALIHLDQQGDNSITVVPGANAQGGTWALQNLEQVLTPHDILALQLEVSLDVVCAAITMAKRVGATVMLDPAPCPDYIPQEFFQADILTPNQGEAERILQRRIEDIDQARNATRTLHKLGIATAIITLGSQGIVWTNSQGTFYEAACRVKSIDSTGAGDTFAGALAALLDGGHGMGNSIALANRAAALATTRIGAQSALPRLQEVLDQYATQPEPH